MQTTSNATQPAIDQREDAYIAAEIRLASLLGWTKLKVVNDAVLGTPPEGHYCVRGEAMAPMWARCWKSCAPLMAQYNCWPSRSTTAINVNIIISGKYRLIAIQLGNHESIDDAIRFGIVTAVSNKLTLEK